MEEEARARLLEGIYKHTAEKHESRVRTLLSHHTFVRQLTSKPFPMISFRSISEACYGISSLT